MGGRANERVPEGEVIAGKYKVERVLGAGGMGVVYAARHVDLHEVFALKLMRPEEVDPYDDEPEEQDTAGRDAAIERFLREARAAFRLRSEHVVKVHDVGRLEDGTPYMVMEYLEGIDLRKLFKQRGPLPVEQVAEYASQACEALAEAHAMGIVHRDIKPANLFLTQRPNGTPCVKVLDFGIAKQLGQNKGMDVTNTSDMLGSPFYMAPEQMRSGRSADPRSDIWSLGVVLYELAGGKPPFVGSSITEVCARVLQDTPVPLPVRVPQIHPDFDRIVQRCLEKEAENRYQTAAELAGALEPFRDARAPLQSGAPLQITDSIQSDRNMPSAPDPSTIAGSSKGVSAPPPAAAGSRFGMVLVAIACTVVGALVAILLISSKGPATGALGEQPAPSVETGASASTGSAVPAETSESATSAQSATVTASDTASAEATTSVTASASATASVPPKPAITAPLPTSTVQKPKPPRVVDYGDRQ